MDHTAHRPAHWPSADYFDLWTKKQNKTHRQNYESFPPSINASLAVVTSPCTNLSVAALQPPGCVQRWTWCYGVLAGCRVAALGLCAPGPCSSTWGWREPWPPVFGLATLSPPHTGFWIPVTSRLKSIYTLFIRQICYETQLLKDACFTWLLHCSWECHDDSKVS